MSGTNLGTPPGPTGQGWEPRSEVMAITESSDSSSNWRKLISRYLRPGAKSNDKAETQRLAHRAKGYLMHDDELYRHSTSFNDAFPLMKVRCHLLTFTKKYVASRFVNEYGR
jgi:hypothetical protein